MKSCGNLTCSLFNANVLKSTKGLIKKKKTTNTIQDPTVIQHQHIIFIIISKQIKSVLTFCNYIQILQTHNYNSDLIAIMTHHKGVGITPASVTFRLPNKQMQSVVYVQKCRDWKWPRPKSRVPA